MSINQSMFLVLCRAMTNAVVGNVSKRLLRGVTFIVAALIAVFVFVHKKTNGRAKQKITHVLLLCKGQQQALD